MIPGADAMDVTIGAAGPQGLTGPAGPKGDTGETGPPGLPGAKGDTGEKGDRGQNGPKGLNWRSVWEAGTSYSTADAESHEGASWVALRDSTGVPPADGADWSLLAAHGEPGERGADGQQGIPGNLALAGLSCQGGTFLRGFSSTGTLLCANASAQCGNGIVEPGEQCDDGNIFSGDGCSRLCRIEVCGNGILDPPYEQCDDGNTRSGDGCSAFCTYERCGNGILDPGEECDDGNTVDGDGCSAACRIEP
jgi:cysteine-rich repeat protein